MLEIIGTKINQNQKVQGSQVREGVRWSCDTEGEKFAKWLKCMSDQKEMAICKVQSSRTIHSDFLVDWEVLKWNGINTIKANVRKNGLGFWISLHMMPILTLSLQGFIEHDGYVLHKEPVSHPECDNGGATPFLLHVKMIQHYMLRSW